MAGKLGEMLSQFGQTLQEDPVLKRQINRFARRTAVGLEQRAHRVRADGRAQRSRKNVKSGGTSSFSQYESSCSAVILNTFSDDQNVRMEIPKCDAGEVLRKSYADRKKMIQDKYAKKMKNLNDQGAQECLQGLGKPGCSQQ